MPLWNDVPSPPLIHSLSSIHHVVTLHSSLPYQPARKKRPLNLTRYVGKDGYLAFQRFCAIFFIFILSTTLHGACQMERISLFFYKLLVLHRFPVSIIGPRVEVLSCAQKKESGDSEKKKRIEGPMYVTSQDRSRPNTLFGQTHPIPGELQNSQISNLLGLMMQRLCDSPLAPSWLVSFFFFMKSPTKRERKHILIYLLSSNFKSWVDA
jgi:hypothetical protein